MPGYEEAEALSLILAGIESLGKGICAHGAACLPSVILNSGFQRNRSNATMMELVSVTVWVFAEWMCVLRDEDGVMRLDE